MSLKDILIKARALIANPEHWCQNAAIRDVHGNAIHDKEEARKNMYSICVNQALFQATKYSTVLHSSVLSLVMKVAPTRVYDELSLTGWNDLATTIHEDVISLLTKAIDDQ